MNENLRDFCELFCIDRDEICEIFTNFSTNYRGLFLNWQNAEPNFNTQVNLSFAKHLSHGSRPRQSVPYFKVDRQQIELFESRSKALVPKDVLKTALTIVTVVPLARVVQNLTGTTAINVFCCR